MMATQWEINDQDYLKHFLKYLNNLYYEEFNDFNWFKLVFKYDKYNNDFKQLCKLLNIYS